MAMAPDLSAHTVPDRLLWSGDFLRDVSIDFSVSSYEVMVNNEQSIESMLCNIWLTAKGERPFEPTFGTNIMALLHEPCDQQTAWYIEEEIFDGTATWMPYIEINKPNTSAIPDPDRNLFRIQFAYTHLLAGLKSGFVLNLVR